MLFHYYFILKQYFKAITVAKHVLVRENAASKYNILI